MNFKIEQKVKFCNEEYTIIGISPNPFIEFDDGSKHYCLTIINKDNIKIYVNDAQIEAIKE